MGGLTGRCESFSAKGSTSVCSSPKRTSELARKIVQKKILVIRFSSLSTKRGGAQCYQIRDVPQGKSWYLGLNGEWALEADIRNFKKKIR